MLEETALTREFGDELLQAQDKEGNCGADSRDT